MTYREEQQIKKELNGQQRDIKELVISLGMFITVFGLLIDYTLVVATGIIYLVAGYLMYKGGRK